MGEQRWRVGIRLVDIPLVGIRIVVDSPAELGGMHLDNLAEADIHPADKQAERSPGVDNQVEHTVADSLEADNPAADILAARNLEVGSLVADTRRGSLAAGSQLGIPAEDSHTQVDTDIPPADTDIPVAPDMVAAEFQVAVDFQKQAHH